MKRFLTIVLTLAFVAVAGTSHVLAQSTANYLFTDGTTGSFTDMTGSSTLIGPNNDDAASVVTQIGFDFWFMGARYNQFSVNSNGSLRLGSTAIASTAYNPLGSAASTVFITACGSDQRTHLTGKVHYKVTGLPGSRVLTVEWLNMQANFASGGTADMTYQVRLYETSGVIENVYGPMTMSVAGAGDPNSRSPHIGISSGSAALQTGYVDAPQSGVPAPAYVAPFTGIPPEVNIYTAGTITVLNSTTDGSRRIFTYTPDAIAPPTALTTSLITASSMQLDWTASITPGVLGDAIYRSSDGGATYQFVASVVAPTVTYTATGLNGGTTYDWQVRSFRESMSAPATASATTLTGTISGTRNIGPTGFYASLTAAIADLNTFGITAPGVTLEFQPTYASGVETFPIVIGNIPGISSASPLLIRPEIGSTGLVITSGATQTIDLSQASYVTIDGRAGGVGPVELTIANTSVSGNALRFINDARNNTIRNCVIAGVNTSTSNGVILFSTTTPGITGNSYNMITECQIRDDATTPTTLIYSSGTATSANTYNRGNVISNNDILNWHSTSATTLAAISLAAATADWMITGNSFFQTAPRTPVLGATVNAILASNTTTVGGLTIAGNYIGGSGPLAGGGPMTYLNGVIRLIQTTVFQNPVTEIQGNVIRNISLTSASTSTSQSLMSIITGSYNIGTVMGNTLGSQTTTGDITVTISGIGANFSGMLCGTGTPGTINIHNNTIGGIAIGGTGTVLFRGIQAQISTGGGPASYTVVNNVVGSPVVPASISNSTNATLVPIVVTASAGGLIGPVVAGNLVANIVSTTTLAAGPIQGITVSGSTVGNALVANNVVRDMATSTSLASPTFSVLGIAMTAGTLGGHSVANNTIHSLANTNGTAAAIMAGVFWSGPTVGVNSFNANLIHSLSLSTTSLSGAIWGLYHGAGIGTFSNNMVRIGIDAAGASITTEYQIIAIHKATAAVASYFYNSLFVGGTGVGTGTTLTAALARTAGTTDDFRNNILVNARSNATTGGEHDAMFLTTATGLVSNNNAFYAPGTGGMLGNAGGVPYASLALWTPGTGLDANSVEGDPMFVDATGPAASVDLHIIPAAGLVESRGVPVGVLDDYDGQPRHSTWPDIGADEYTGPAPGPFALTTPADGSIGQPITGSLNWGASPGAVSYEVALDTVPVPVTPAPGSPTGTNSLSYSVSPGTYHWDVTAKNASGSVPSSNGPFDFTTVTPPADPTALVATPTGPVPNRPVADDERVGALEAQLVLATDKEEVKVLHSEIARLREELLRSALVSGIDLTWTDNAPDGPNQEDGFYIYAKLGSAPDISGGPSSPDFLDSVAAVSGSGGTGTYTHTPLGLNENWHYKVTSFNIQGQSAPASADTTTFVETPGAPTFSDVRWNRMTIILDISGNPGTAEEYAIHETSTGKYLAANGTLSSATEVWQTYSAWGGLAGQLITGLTRNTLYTFEVKARNADNVETPFGPSASQSTTTDQGSVVLFEEFTGVTFPPAGWARDNGPPAPAQPTWTREAVTMQANGSAGHAARYNFYGPGSTTGRTDTLKSVPVDLSGAIAATVSWNHAYASFSGEVDSIFVIISSDGGATWTLLEADGYPGMATAPNSGPRFVPSLTSHWRDHSYDIPGAFLTANMRIAWASKSAYGNDYHLDDVTIVAKTPANTIIVRKYADADGNFATNGDWTLKNWYLAVYADSVDAGTLVASGTTDSLTVADLADGTYIAVEADSLGWSAIGVVSNGTPNAGAMQQDTIVLSGGGIVWITDFVNYQVPGAPVFVADPTNINFSNTVVGDTSTSSIRVYNTGIVTLNISAVASDDANFEVDPTSGVIAAGDSADFTVRFIPVSLGAKSGNIVFTHDAATSPDTVTVSGTGVSTPVSTSFLSVPPETLYATVGGKFPKPVKRPKPGKPIIMPNWANLMSEGVAQGGFAPGTVESDSAGGMVIGVSHMFLAGPNKWKPIKDSANVRAWVRITKYDFKKNIGKGFNVMQKTLNAKGQVHTGGPRGFDLFANGKPMKKQLTKLLPAKQNNVMFAELLALKFNIAMSALGKIPAGFGDLIFERTGNPFDQMSVSEISQLADSMMTYHGGYVQEDYDSLLSTVGDINRAFVGALDTLSWIQADSSFPLGKLVLAGVKDIDSVSYLKLPNPFVATVTTPSSYEVESEEEMDFEDDEEFESQPIAAKLYQNYPNPFNPTTTLSFRLREDSKVSLKVYNMLGQEVASLLNNEEMEEGVQVLQFNAADLSSGIYFYRIQAEGLEDNGFKTVETGKMVLLK